MYFENFPQILHSYTGSDGQEVLVLLKDITANIRFRKDVLQNITLYDEYDIREGDTPELISERFYGSPQYHWVVMLVNDLHDYATDFPLPYDQLMAYTTQKYGSGHEYDIHHYVYNGFVVNSDYVGATSVSNFDYEDSLNEGKRRIKLISPTLLSTVLQSFQELMR